MLDPLRCLEVVWGDGNRLMTGEAGSFGSLEEDWKANFAQVAPPGPAQTDFYKIVSAAEGSMGIVTWASIKCEVLPRLHKLFFVPSQRLDNLIDFLYRVLRFRFGDELLLLNGSNLASILGNGIDRVRALQEEFPPWVLIVGVAGREVLPGERVEFQRRDISDIAQQLGLQLLPAIPGAGTGEVLEALLKPSKEPYWKIRHHGSCQDIFFLTTLNRTPEFVRTMFSVAGASGYPTSEIGVYIQPIHQGASCHCEFSLPFDPNDPEEVTRARTLFTRASEELLNQGAFFSRPYGIWANMSYNRDAQTMFALKKIKKIFDPNNIMNPGKLCF
jgi:FAD/FMN-containing dehydrogenase